MTDHTTLNRQTATPRPQRARPGHPGRSEPTESLEGNDPNYGYDATHEAALTRLYADLGISPIDGSDLDSIVTSDDKAEAWGRFYAVTEAEGGRPTVT